MKPLQLISILGTAAIVTACSSQTVRNSFPDTYNDHHYWAARQAIKIGEPELAEEHLKAAAENGSYTSMAWLGHIYTNGTGVDKNLEAALKWYEKAIVDPSGDNAQLMKRVGDIYARGEGTAVDTAKAEDFWKRAYVYYTSKEDLTVSEAQLLGMMYARGQGVEADGEKAVALLKAHYTPGLGSIARLLGDIYYDGLGLRQNLPEARKWYTASFEEGDPVRLYRLGFMYLDGQGVEPNPEKAHQYFAQYLGYLESKLNNDIHDSQIRELAYMYSKGHGTKADGEHAISLAKRLVGKDGGISERIIGDIYIDALGLEKSDPAQAVAWYEKSIAQGDPARLTRLAYIYSSGDGVERDLEKANKHWQASIQHLENLGQRRSPSETRRLSVMYAKGEGTQANTTRAIEILQPYVGRGDGYAEYLIGDYYYMGYGLDKPDPAKALEWYAKAANEGAIERLKRLGDMYDQAEGTKRDPALAEKYWQMAFKGYEARGENASTGELTTLARMYGFGQGTPKNEERALALFKKASERGDLNATRLAGDMAYNIGEMATARDFYQIAHEGGNTTRIKRYAAMLRDGLGGTADEAKARALFTSAIATLEKKGTLRSDNDTLQLGRLYLSGDSGEVQAQKGLALLESISARVSVAPVFIGDYYYERENPDYKKALAAYQKSFDMGDESRLKRVAFMYERGQGVPANQAKAQAFLKKAKNR